MKNKKALLTCEKENKQGTILSKQLKVNLYDSSEQPNEGSPGVVSSLTGKNASNSCLQFP